MAPIFYHANQRSPTGWPTGWTELPGRNFRRRQSHLPSKLSPCSRVTPTLPWPGIRQAEDIYIYIYGMIQGGDEATKVSTIGRHSMSIATSIAFKKQAHLTGILYPDNEYSVNTNDWEPKSTR